MFLGTNVSCSSLLDSKINFDGIASMNIFTSFGTSFLMVQTPEVSLNTWFLGSFQITCSEFGWTLERVQVNLKPSLEPLGLEDETAAFRGTWKCS